MSSRNGLSNFYIEDILFPLSKVFKGVYSCNVLPQFNKSKNFSCIVNLSHSSQKGTHFVAIFYKHENKKIMYFDSYGLPLVNVYIKKFINNYDINFVFSTRQIQSLQSDFCGYFCCAFVISIERNVSFVDFCNCFDYIDLEKNDDYVINMLQDIIKYT